MFGSNAGPLGADQTGFDDHNVNTEGGGLHAEGIAQRFDGMFAGVIPTTQESGKATTYGGDVDDGAGSLGAHVGEDKLGEACETKNIDLELAAGFISGDVFNGAEGPVAGVVDQDIDTPGFGDDFLDAAGHGFIVGHVHCQGMDSYGGEFFQSVGAACGGVDGVAELVEGACCFFADAGGCACDKCGLAHDGGVSLVIYNYECWFTFYCEPTFTLLQPSCSEQA